jgi:hypothetical protein
VAIGTCRTNGGIVPSGRSAPAMCTKRPVSLTPARFMTSASRAPVHRAVPTAPLVHWMPATAGEKNARPLPAHSSVTVVVTAGIWRNSATLSDSAVLTSPSTRSDQLAASSGAGTGR